MAGPHSEGDTLAAVSNSIASLLHECYGGPESVKSYFLGIRARSSSSR